MSRADERVKKVLEGYHERLELKEQNEGLKSYVSQLEERIDELEREINLAQLAQAESKRQFNLVHKQLWEKHDDMQQLTQLIQENGVNFQVSQSELLVQLQQQKNLAETFKNKSDSLNLELQIKTNLLASLRHQVTELETKLCDTIALKKRQEIEYKQLLINEKRDVQEREKLSSELEIKDRLIVSLKQNVIEMEETLSHTVVLNTQQHSEYKQQLSDKERQAEQWKKQATKERGEGQKRHESLEKQNRELEKRNLELFNLSKDQRATIESLRSKRREQELQNAELLKKNMELEERIKALTPPVSSSIELVPVTSQIELPSSQNTKKSKKKKKKKKGNDEPGTSASSLKTELKSTVVSSTSSPPSINSNTLRQQSPKVTGETTTRSKDQPVAKEHKYDRVIPFHSLENDQFYKSTSGLAVDKILEMEKNLPFNKSLVDNILQECYRFETIGEMQERIFFCGVKSALGVYMIALLLYSSYDHAPSCRLDAIQKAVESAANVNYSFDKQGLPQAQFWWASWLASGNKEFGVAQNQKEATRFYLLAAAQGYLPAKQALASNEGGQSSLVRHTLLRQPTAHIPSTSGVVAQPGS